MPDQPATAERGFSARTSYNLLTRKRRAAGGAREDLTFVNNKQYSVDQAIYPDDLMGEDNAYGNNMVVFYISVQEDSKLLNDGSAERADGRSLERFSSVVAQNNITDGQATAAIVGTTAAGGSVGGLVLASGKYVGAALGAGAGALAASKTGKSKRESRTIKQAIGLYMPSNLSTNYAMGWDVENTLLGSSIIEMEEAYNKSKKGSGLADSGSSGLSAIAGAVLSTNSIASRLTASTGNPKKEQIFQGVDFRTFSYEYKFWPRSAGEAGKVQEIINLFKLHMHPELHPGAGNFIFMYPSEFDIRYYHRAEGEGAWVENLNIHRHTSCVLSNMSVSYGENGVYSSFADGHPTQISVTLQFKELALLTKENIQNGY